MREQGNEDVLVRLRLLLLLFEQVNGISKGIAFIQDPVPPRSHLGSLLVGCGCFVFFGEGCALKAAEFKLGLKALNLCSADSGVQGKLQ
jgi:hypothetical protein